MASELAEILAASADVTRFFLGRFAKPQSTGFIMIVHRSILILVVLATCVSPGMTQGTAVISPIFSELVMHSLPKGFRKVSERTNGRTYVREAVLEGETVERWSQVIAVAGAKDLASNASPQWLVEAYPLGSKELARILLSWRSLVP
jgi:hypothetical protein